MTEKFLLLKERRGILGNINLFHYSDLRTINEAKKATNISFDWIYDVIKQCRFKEETFFTACNIFSSYLSRQQSNTSQEDIVERKSLILIACSSISLASKYHDINPLDTDTYIHISDRRFTKEILIRKEKHIFSTIGCNVDISCESSCIDILCTNANRSLAQLVVILVMTNYTVVVSDYLPTLLTTALMKLVTGEYLHHFIWDKQVIDYCSSKIAKIIKNISSDDIAFMSFRSSISANKVNKVDLYPYLKSSFFKPDIQIPLVNELLLTTRHLGKGTFSVVKEVKYQDKLYAMKEFRNEHELYPPFIREVSILLTLHHPNIITIKHIDIDLRRILTDVARCDLDKYLSCYFLSLEEQLTLANQLISAVKYLHSMSYLHRDIKPQNILVFTMPIDLSFTDGKTKFVLADFGSARRALMSDTSDVQYSTTNLPRKDSRTKYTEDVCTLSYRAPELLQGTKRYNKAIDIWGVGCVLHESVTGETLFDGRGERDQLSIIHEILGSLEDTQEYRERCLLRFTSNKKLPEQYREILRRSLRLDPTERSWM